MKEKIIIQQEKIEIADAYGFLDNSDDGEVGAMVVFSGLMRTHNQQGAIKNMMMEHYEKMTEASIAAIIARAQEKFSFKKIIVLHRVGKIMPHDIIVVVGVAAKHRKDAFHTADMVMDYLKSEVPLWKKEIMDDEASDREDDGKNNGQGNGQNNRQNNRQGDIWVAQTMADSNANKKWE